MIRVAALELLHVTAFAYQGKQYDLLVQQKVKMTFLLDTYGLRSRPAIALTRSPRRDGVVPREKISDLALLMLMLLLMDDGDERGRQPCGGSTLFILQSSRSLFPQDSLGAAGV